jgi:hypothetical protein
LLVDIHTLVQDSHDVNFVGVDRGGQGRYATNSMVVQAADFEKSRATDH